MRLLDRPMTECREGSRKRGDLETTRVNVFRGLPVPARRSTRVPLELEVFRLSPSVALRRDQAGRHVDHEMRKRRFL